MGSIIVKPFVDADAKIKDSQSRCEQMRHW
jgi:hypothetical protein